MNHPSPDEPHIRVLIADDDSAFLESLQALIDRQPELAVVGRAADGLEAIELAEALATADVPGGVVNIVTGLREELAPWLAGHMDVNALDVTGADGEVAELERLAAENVKRVVRGAADDQSAWEISRFLELKTVWHPIGV